jgi:hypothetical protein
VEAILEYREMLRPGGGGPDTTWAKAFRKNHAKDADFTRRAFVLDKLYRLRWSLIEDRVLCIIKQGPIAGPDLTRRLGAEPTSAREEAIFDVLVDLIDRHIIGVDEEHRLFMNP